MLINGTMLLTFPRQKAGLLLEGAGTPRTQVTPGPLQHWLQQFLPPNLHRLYKTPPRSILPAHSIR